MKKNTTPKNVGKEFPSQKNKWIVVTPQGSSFRVVSSNMTDKDRQSLSINRRLSDIKVTDPKVDTEKKY